MIAALSLVATAPILTDNAFSYCLSWIYKSKCFLFLNLTYTELYSSFFYYSLVITRTWRIQLLKLVCLISSFSAIPSACEISRVFKVSSGYPDTIQLNIWSIFVTKIILYFTLLLRDAISDMIVGFLRIQCCPTLTRC